jgi:alkylhydroperoxidase family enzyme
VARLPVVEDPSIDPILEGLFKRMHDQGLNVPNLYMTIGNAPRMLQAWMDFTWPLRHEGVSPRSLREVVIMRVAQSKQATYVWSHHWDMAVAAGISPEQLESLGDWRSAGLFDDKQAAVLAYADEVIGGGGVTDPAFAEMRRLFSNAEIVELTLAATFYLNLAHFAKALQIELEPKYEKYAQRLPGGHRHE